MYSNIDDVTYSNIKKNIEKIFILPNVIINEWKPNRGYVYLYKNKNNRNIDKCIVYVHGGSFLHESPNEDSYTFFCCILCHLTGYDIYCPDFVLPPIKKYPGQLEDIYKIYVHLKKSYKNIIIGGNSSGGCIVLSTLLKYPNTFTECFLISPWLNLNCNSSSYYSRRWSENTKTGDPIFTLSPKKNSRYFINDAKIYLGNQNLFNNKIANPYYATNSLLKFLPPILLLVGDNETIRNDTLDFSSRAQKNNDNIFVSLYDNMWHDWLLYKDNNSGKYGIDGIIHISSFCKGYLIKTNENKNVYFYNDNHIKSNVNLSIVL